MPPSHSTSQFTVVGAAGFVWFETDDWVAAERYASDALKRREVLFVRGTHPTHTWAEKRCTGCGAWDNGSYGSHAPCGYDWSSDSLISALDREEAARVA